MSVHYRLNSQRWFKTFYCPICGEKLVVAKNARDVPEWEYRQEYRFRGIEPYIFGATEIVETFYCPKCHYRNSIDNQLFIRKKQKELNKIIFDEDDWNSISYTTQGEKIEPKKDEGTGASEEELAKANRVKMMVETDNILKMRWLLLIPVLGAVICMIKIFNGCLEKYTGIGDLRNIVFASILTFMGVAVPLKSILSMSNVDFLYDYRTIIMFLIASFAFNIPMLIYINKTFKY